MKKIILLFKNSIKSIISFFIKIISSILKPFDVNDLFFFVGLILIFVGLSKYMPWIAYTVDGTLLVLIGLFGKK